MRCVTVASPTRRLTRYCAILYVLAVQPATTAIDYLTSSLKAHFLNDGRHGRGRLRIAGRVLKRYANLNLAWGALHGECADHLTGARAQLAHVLAAGARQTGWQPFPTPFAIGLEELSHTIVIFDSRLYGQLECVASGHVPSVL